MSGSQIAILGAGSWGTALAINLAKNNNSVILWSRDAKHVAKMQQDNANERYLPGIRFPKSLTVTDSLAYCTSNSDKIIIAVPSHAFLEIFSKIDKPESGLTWITKGINPENNKLLSETVFAKWGSQYPIAVVSGPSFAKEVALGMPTALVIASNDLQYAEAMSKHLHNDNLRCYIIHDINGVQVCGAVKNVIAIACGISDGLSYGANARAALITRGIAEMLRLGTVFNADPETFIGLAGVGDLVLTCTDNQSRNRRFGMKLGQGITAEDAKLSIGQVVEGSQNAIQIHKLATSNKIEMPICSEVYAILQNQTTPQESAQRLMNRPVSAEDIKKTPN